MPAVGSDRLVLGRHLAIAIAKYFESVGLGTYGGPEGGDLKTGELVDEPLRQIAIRCDGGGRAPGEVVSKPHVLIRVRNKNTKLVVPDVERVVALLHKQSPPLEGLAFYFTWDAHESDYRDQNRNVIVPLGFSASGHALVNAA